MNLYRTVPEEYIVTGMKFSHSWIYGSRYSRMNQVNFVEETLFKFEVIWSA